MGEIEDTLGAPPAPPDELAIEGATIGAYKIDKLLGEGAMGKVFHATHVSLGRPVAIKMLKPAIAADRAMTERFFAEARAVNVIRHENIVECTDLVNDPGRRSYIVMELLEGRTLGAAILDAGKIPVRRAARIVAQICDAIGAAHDKGIVHRDLKPENVYLIKRSGTSDYVKILDFGIARLRPDFGVAATQSGAVVGTPAYMSPEQVRGEKVGPGADIYSVGLMLFHMLTGRMAFQTTQMSMMLVAQLQETPKRVDELVPEVPKEVADVVARTLAKDPAERPQNMAQLRAELLAAAGMPTEPDAALIDSQPRISAERSAVVAARAVASAHDATMPPTAIKPAPKSGQRMWLLGGAAVVVVGSVIAMFAIGLGGTRPPEEPNVGAIPPRVPVKDPEPVKKPPPPVPTAATVADFVTTQAAALRGTHGEFADTFDDKAVVWFPHALVAYEGRAKIAAGPMAAWGQLGAPTAVEPSNVIVGMANGIAWATTQWRVTLGDAKTTVPVRITELIALAPTVHALAAQLSTPPPNEDAGITGPEPPAFAGWTKPGTGPERWLAIPGDLAVHLRDDPSTSYVGRDDTRASGAAEVRKLLVARRRVNFDFVGDAKVFEGPGYKAVLGYLRWRMPQQTPLYRVLGVFVPGKAAGSWELGTAHYAVAVPASEQSAKLCTIAALDCSQYTARSETGRTLQALVGAASQSGRHAEAICMVRPNLAAPDKALAGAANLEMARAWEKLGCHVEAIAAAESAIAIRPHDDAGWKDTCTFCKKLGGACVACDEPAGAGSATP